MLGQGYTAQNLLFSFHGIHIWNHISKKNSIYFHMLVSRIYAKVIYEIITFHIELNNGQTVISFSFMLFFIYY